MNDLTLSDTKYAIEQLDLLETEEDRIETARLLYVVNSIPELRGLNGELD